MSPLALSMVSESLPESRTILFDLVESTRMSRSAPSVSSKMRRCPLRDLMTRMLFLPSSFFCGGLCCVLHSPPTMIGRRMSPCSNTTST